MKQFRVFNPYTNTSQGCPKPYTKSGQSQPTQHLTNIQSSDSTDLRTKLQKERNDKTHQKESTTALSGSLEQSLI